MFTGGLLGVTLASSVMKPPSANSFSGVLNKSGALKIAMVI